MSNSHPVSGCGAGGPYRITSSLPMHEYDKGDMHTLLRSPLLSQRAGQQGQEYPTWILSSQQFSVKIHAACRYSSEFHRRPRKLGNRGRSAPHGCCPHSQCMWYTNIACRCGSDSIVIPESWATGAGVPRMDAVLIANACGKQRLHAGIAQKSIAIPESWATGAEDPHVDDFLIAMQSAKELQLICGAVFRSRQGCKSRVSCVGLIRAYQ